MNEMSAYASMNVMIDGLSSCVIAYIREQWLFDTTPPMNLNSCPADDLDKVLGEWRSWERTHEDCQLNTRMVISNTAKQLAADLESVKPAIDCTDVLELSNIISTPGVDLIVVRLKWARVAAQLTRARYLVSDKKQPIESVSVDAEPFCYTAKELRAIENPKSPVSESTFRTSRKAAGIGDGVKGRRFSPDDMIAYGKERIETTFDEDAKQRWRDEIQQCELWQSKQPHKLAR